MTRSATETVLLFLLLFGVPMLLLGLHLNYVEGTLTVDWALHVAVYTLLITAAFGLFAWYTFVRGLQRRAIAKTVSGRSAEPEDSVRSGMIEAPSFKFCVTYDLKSVQAAGRTLFRQYWVARRVGTIGALIALLFSIALCLRFRAYEALWFAGSLAALNVLIWPFQWRAIGNRSKRNLGTSAEIQFTNSDLSLGSYRLAWSRILFSRLDETNLYLFVSAISAITIPRKDLTADAIAFAKSKVRFEPVA